MPVVKTAISIDAPLLHRVDEAAAELELPRSRLFALAAEDFLRRLESRRMLETLNRNHVDGPAEEDVELRRRWMKHQHERFPDSW